MRVPYVKNLDNVEGNKDILMLNSKGEMGNNEVMVRERGRPDTH